MMNFSPKMLGTIDSNLDLHIFHDVPVDSFPVNVGRNYISY